MKESPPAPNEPAPAAPIEEIDHQGWRFQIAMAGRDAFRFHAFYLGRDFGRPGRGALAVVASGLNDADAAALAAHSLAEGYFGARETLSPLRAAAAALAAINLWLYDQGHGRAAAVSLLAILFVGSKIELIQAGDCEAICWRDGGALPLTGAASGRAVGTDPELPLETSSEEAAAGDRYLLLTHGARWNAVDHPASLSPQQLADWIAAAGSNAVVVDVLAVPRATHDEIAAIYAALPLRPPPHQGEVWDGFRIGRKLNQGRYTVLHLAEDLIEHRSLVLKIPLPGIVSDQIFRAGFLRESWIGTKVASPFVGRYVTLAPGRQTTLYLAMPFYHGETLEQRLGQPEKVGLLEGLQIAEKLCHAISDLARVQVIHRDIKPENILLLADGDLRLLDLGIAYLPGLDRPHQPSLGGTTRYMAPELFRDVTANQQTELYSLGVTLYRMWSGGGFPFGQAESRPLARLRPDLPDWVGACLARCFAPEPRRRYATAADFAAALETKLMSADLAPSPRGGARLLYWQIAVAVLVMVNLVLLVVVIRR